MLRSRSAPLPAAAFDLAGSVGAGCLYTLELADGSAAHGALKYDGPVPPKPEPTPTVPEPVPEPVTKPGGYGDHVRRLSGAATRVPLPHLLQHGRGLNTYGHRRLSTYDSHRRLSTYDSHRRLSTYDGAAHHRRLSTYDDAAHHRRLSTYDSHRRLSTYDGAHHRRLSTYGH